jgi:tRNA1Val (adenine37-N6)-methyltransferase
MKVCTDACLFGGWLADKKDVGNKQHMLDIGAGTGLLSLMLAQKTKAMIDAVEIDVSAAEQTIENFEKSSWKERLQLFNSAVQEWTPSTKYDLIISNPPFFDNDLKSNDHKRNLALHSTALGLEELILFTERYLDDDGSFAILLPYHRTNTCVDIASEKGLHLKEKVLVKQTPKHNCFRSMMLFSRTPGEPAVSTIIIKNADNLYSQEFIHLLKDYYLHLVEN